MATHTVLLSIFFLAGVRFAVARTRLEITGMGSSLNDLCVVPVGNQLRKRITLIQENETTFEGATFVSGTPTWKMYHTYAEHQFDIVEDSPVYYEFQNKTEVVYHTHHTKLSIIVTTINVVYILPSTQENITTSLDIKGYFVVACSAEYTANNTGEEEQTACDKMNEELIALDGKLADDITKCSRKKLIAYLTCTEPVIDNGIVTYVIAERNEESYVAFTCTSGYEVKGPEMVTCKNGTWQQDMPLCAPVDCGPLPDLPGKGLTATVHNATTFGSRANYTCMTGYVYTSGPNTAVCTNKGTWQNPRMYCTIKDCGVLSNPIRGFVEMMATTYDSTATYSCIPGLKISDPALETRVCQANSTWSGQAPTCELLDSLPKVTLICATNCGKIANPMEPVGVYVNCSTCTIDNDIGFNWANIVCDSADCCPDQGELELNENRFHKLYRRNESVYYRVKVVVMAMQYHLWYFDAIINITFGAMPPEDGACRVSPTSGFSMVTEFSISCTGFDSIPDYGFTVNYYSNVENTLTNAILLGTSGQKSMLDGVKLQEGNTDDGDSLYILVEAVYVSGAKALVTTSIQVEPFSASDVKLDDVMKELIDLDPNGEGGGQSMVEKNLANNDVNGALLGMELAISTMTSSTGSNTGDSNSGEQTEADVEKQKKVHAVLTDYLDKVVNVVKSPEELFRAATVLKKSASVLASVKTSSGKPAPKPEPDEKTENIVAEMVEKFEVLGKNSTEEQKTQVATLLLESLGDMLYTEEPVSLDNTATPGSDNGEDDDMDVLTEEEQMAKKERGHKRNERLISQSDKLANVLLSSKLPGQGSTVLKTPQMKLSVAKMTPGHIESPDFGDDEDACKLDLPTSLPMSDPLTDVGIQAMQIKSNPFTRDESAKDVNMNVLKIEIKDNQNKPLTFTNLETPAVFKYPVEKANNMSSKNNFLYLFLQKTNNIIHFEVNKSSVMVFHIDLTPNKTIKFSVECEIPLLVHIAENYYSVLKDVHTKGTAFPEDIDVFRKRYSGFDDLDMIRNASYNNTGENVIIDFAYNDTLGLLYAGVTVDLRRDDVLDWLRSKDPECLGNENVTDCKVIQDVPMKAVSKSLQCLYWDTKKMVWSIEGCQVFPYTDSQILECSCNHMTSFSGGVFVMPNMVDPLDFALFLTFFDNPVVITAVIVVWILYFFLIHWARQADKQDLEHAGVLWSGGYGDSNNYVYLMCIATGWWADAGTTANVFCFIQGSKGDSTHRKLTRSVRPCFQSGFDDWIVFTTKQSLGDLNQISFWHDNTGSSPHWYLKQVFVVDQQSRTSWTFIYNDWLALDRGSILSTTASVTSVTKEELSEKTGYNFNVKTTRDLRDGHLWLSIFSKPTHSTFTRVQRLTCALSLLLTTMLANIMFYGIPTEDPADQVGTPTVTISLSAIVIGIESSLLMFPINVIILQLFLRAKRKPTREPVNFEEVQDGGKKPSDKSLSELRKRGQFLYSSVMTHMERQLLKITTEIQGESSVDMTYCPGNQCSATRNQSASTSKQPKNAVTLINENKQPGKILPWWSIYITWSLVVAISVSCSYLVMLYGLKYGYHTSIMWLVSFLTGFAQSAFITQPLKVLIIASIITLIFKKTVEFEDYGPEIKRDRDEVFENDVKAPGEIHIPYTEPLSVKILAEIRERLRLEWLMDQTLRDIGLYVIYMTVVLLMVHDQRYTMEAFLNTNAVEKVLVNSGCDDACFEEVSTVDDFYSYMHEIAAPNLADMTISDHEFATPCSSHFLLGTWRLRQLRVDHDSCYKGVQELFKTFNMNVPECTGPYWLGDADTHSYNGSWSNKLPERPENGTQWSYQSSWQLKTIPVAAKLATYSGGGFVVTMHADHSQHYDQIQDIFNTDWIDQRTRAIFFEFTLYNPNADLFAVVMLIFEFSNNGAIIPSHQIYSAKLYHYSTDYAYVKTICEFMFLFFNIGFTYVEWNKYTRLGKAYFDDFWSYIEVIQIILSYSVIGLFFQRMLSIDSIMEDYRHSDPGAYISFYTAISWDVILGYLLAFLVALNTMKSVKLLRFNRRAFMVGDAIAHSKEMLFSFMTLAIALSLGFCHFAVMAFGKSLHEYRDFWSSMMAILSFTLGVSDLPGLTQTNRLLGPAFFIIFIFIMQFCFITIFVAILNFGISESKAALQQRKNKLELMQYVIKKCKTVLSIR